MYHPESIVYKLATLHLATLRRPKYPILDPLLMTAVLQYAIASIYYL